MNAPRIRPRAQRLSLGCAALTLLLAPLGAGGANIYVVTSTGDFNIGAGISGDLRYCINQANADPGSSIYIGNVLQPIGPITLFSPLPPITTSMTIQLTPDGGNGSQPVIIDGAGLRRIFFVNAPGEVVTFSGLRLQNGRAKGGNGGGAAGGGLGAGGAIFVNAGQVTANGVTFLNNVAVGGTGGDGPGAAGGGGRAGGGGGLGGNGGNGNAGGGGGGGWGGDGGDSGGTGGGGGGGLIGRGGNGISDGSRSAGGGGGAIGNGGNGIMPPGGAGGSGGGGVGGGSGVDGGDGATNGGGGGGGLRTTSPSAVNARGGRGGTYGGGGGGSGISIAAGGEPGAGGDFGGGGGVGNYHSTSGAGGWGGGGGGGSEVSSGNTSNPGTGGWGAGGGGGSINPATGLGGTFGGIGGIGYIGPGSRPGGGGGGGALGGAVFVRSGLGGSFQANDCTFSGGSVIAGAGGQTIPFSPPHGRNAGSGIPAGPGVFFGDASLVFGGSGSGSIADGIDSDPAHPANLIKTGSGTLTLAGPSAFAGNVTVNAGTLRLAVANALGAATVALTLQGGAALDLGGASPTVGSISGGPATFVTNSATGTTGILTVNVATGSASFESELRNGTGAVGLAKTGAGTLTLSGLSSATGGTTVTGGTLELASVNGSGLGTLAGALTIQTGATVNATNTNAFGYLSGRKIDSVTIEGGTLNHNGTADQGWGVAYTLSNGATMTTNGNFADPAGPAWSFGGPGGAVSPANPNPNSSVLALAGNSQITGRIDLRGDNGNTACLFTVQSGAQLSIPAILTSTNGAPLLTKAGAGTLTLSSTNPRAGGTQVDAGTLVLTGANAFGWGTLVGSLTVASGATVQAAVSDTFGYANGRKLDAVKLNGGTLLHASPANQGWGVAYTLHNGALMDFGPGSNATSSWSFGGPGGAVAPNPNSRVRATGATPSEIRGRIDLRGDNGNTACVFEVDGGSTLVVPAVIVSSGGSPALTKIGSGILRLGGANTYAGTTRLSAGTLALDNAGALGGGGPVILEYGTTFDVSALPGVFVLESARSLTAGGVITGAFDYRATYTGADLTVAAGGLSTRSSGALTLTGAVVNQGTIRLTSGATLNAGGATSFQNNGVLDLITAGAWTLPANFTNGASGVVLLPSLVRVTSVVRDGPSGTVTLKIDGYVGHVYTLESTPDLATPFTVVSRQQGSGTTSGVPLTFVAPLAGARGFLRVVVNP